MYCFIHRSTVFSYCCKYVIKSSVRRSDGNSKSSGHFRASKNSSSDKDKVNKISDFYFLHVLVWLWLVCQKNSSIRVCNFLLTLEPYPKLTWFIVHIISLLLVITVSDPLISTCLFIDTLSKFSTLFNICFSCKIIWGFATTSFTIMVYCIYIQFFCNSWMMGFVRPLLCAKLFKSWLCEALLNCSITVVWRLKIVRMAAITTLFRYVYSDWGVKYVNLDLDYGHIRSSVYTFSLTVYLDLALMNVYFLRASATLKHVLAIGWTSVRPSVCHTLVLCRNGSTYRQTVFTAW